MAQPISKASKPLVITLDFLLSDIKRYFLYILINIHGHTIKDRYVILDEIVDLFVLLLYCQMDNANQQLRNDVVEYFKGSASQIPAFFKVLLELFDRVGRLLIGTGSYKTAIKIQFSQPLIEYAERLANGDYMGLNSRVINYCKMMSAIVIPWSSIKPVFAAFGGIIVVDDHSNPTLFVNESIFGNNKNDWLWILFKGSMKSGDFSNLKNNFLFGYSIEFNSLGQNELNVGASEVLYSLYNAPASRQAPKVLNVPMVQEPSQVAPATAQNGGETPPPDNGQGDPQVSKTNKNPGILISGSSKGYNNRGFKNNSQRGNYSVGKIIPTFRVGGNSTNLRGNKISPFAPASPRV